MRRQGAAVHELQELRQGLLQLRSILQHAVCDAGESDDLRGQAAVGVHEGLEPLRDLAVLHHHGADLRNSLPVHFQASGLNIEADELVVQGLVLSAVDHHPVIQVVNEIALHAVKDFDFIPRSVPGVREGLGAAVVRDGDGGMAPADGLLDDLLGVGQGVRVAHLGM